MGGETRVLRELLSLIEEAATNIELYSNHDILNSEGRKLRGLIVRKLIQVAPERHRQIKRYAYLNDLDGFMKLLRLAHRIVEEKLELL